jgi:hypothetical protein
VANAPVLRHANHFVWSPLDDQRLTDGIRFGPQPRSQDLIDNDGRSAR